MIVKIADITVVASSGSAKTAVVSWSKVGPHALQTSHLPRSVPEDVPARLIKSRRSSPCLR